MMQYAPGFSTLLLSSNSDVAVERLCEGWAPMRRLGAYTGRDMRNMKILRINWFEVKVAVKYVVCVPVFYVDDGRCSSECTRVEFGFGSRYKVT